jgi:hypothetical protein
MEKPQDYYDNRFNKKNAKAPDFKHKQNHEALWLDNRDTPPHVRTWVEQNLGSQ